MLGSCVLSESASVASRSAAGAMWTVWKAPATLSGIRRARVGGFSASPSSCSTVPAATIWPLPLLLAGVSPCAAIAASTSSGLPPITAVIEVGVAALASAIARPRSRTNTRASSSERVPTRAAAVISPTE